MSIIFFSSLCVLLYTFLGYPLILRMAKKEKESSLLSPNDLPKLTVVLAIYNSSKLLTQRVNNIFDSNYPKEKINLLIVSDGSTDNPQSILTELNNPSVKLIHYDENKGKSFALNYAQQYIETDVVAFADIRQSFHPDALLHLASMLTDKTVGAVSGNLKIKSTSDTEEQGLYWRYEKAIRKKESDLYSLLGVTGAIYMTRTALLPPIPEDALLDDMYIPLTMVKQGYKIKFCEGAIAYDTASSSVQEEFTRKVRTLAGNYQLIKQLPWLLSISQNPVFFQFVSHKLARLAMPIALIFLLISSAMIESNLITLFFWGQVAFYLYTLIGYSSKNYHLPLIKTCISFCSLNLAALVATWKYFTVDDITSLWKKH